MLVYDVAAFENMKFDKNCRANNKYQPAKAVYQCLIQFPFASVLLLLLFIKIINVHILKCNHFQQLAQNPTEASVDAACAKFSTLS